MPPASLLTFAVINPGPTTAKKSRIRIFQRLKKFMRTFRRHKDETQPRTATRNVKKRPIFVLISERAGTQSRTRINAPYDSEQTKSVKTSTERKSRLEAFAQLEAGDGSPDSVPRASPAAC